MMRWDLDQVDEPTAYKLLASTVVPRPIAWVVTLNEDGSRNAAPFSFFNVMGSEPPTLAFGINWTPGEPIKDTGRNIQERAEFSVNLVSETQVRQMNITAVNAPVGVDELTMAGLEVTPACHIAAPLIAGAPVSMECRLHQAVPIGAAQMIIIGRVLAIHVADQFVRDASRTYLDTPAMGLVARSYGAEYIRSNDRFDLPRMNWEQWKASSP